MPRTTLLLLMLLLTAQKEQAYLILEELTPWQLMKMELSLGEVSSMKTMHLMDEALVVLVLKNKETPMNVLQQVACSVMEL